MTKKDFDSFDSDDTSSLVNLTPLLDVLFVVLILFIFITPFIDIDKVELVTSQLQDEKGTPLQHDPIVITVTADNQLSINQKHITLEEFTLLIPKLYKQYPHASPKLYHDKNAPFGTYQTIKNALEMSGFKEMDVVLKAP